MVQPTSPAPPAAVVRVLGPLTGLGSVAIGVGLVLDAESSFGVVWASLFVVLGVVVLLSFVAVLPVRPRPATTGSVRGAGRGVGRDVGRDVVLDGEPAQFHPHPLERVRLAGLAALTLLGGWLVVMGVVGAVEETWLWAVLAAVPAAYLLGFPVLTVLGRARAGGWWLTPTRLVAEHHGPAQRGATARRRDGDTLVAERARGARRGGKGRAPFAHALAVAHPGTRG